MLRRTWRSKRTVYWIRIKISRRRRKVKLTPKHPHTKMNKCLRRLKPITKHNLYQNQNWKIAKETETVNNNKSIVTRLLRKT